jgi:hypothetical protein
MSLPKGIVWIALITFIVIGRRSKEGTRGRSHVRTACFGKEVLGVTTFAIKQIALFCVAYK